jgi:hypothetical protein
MAFNVGDVVRKKTKTQKYKVKEVLIGDDYKVQYEPNTAPDVELEFHGQDLELAP